MPLPFPNFVSIWNGLLEQSPTPDVHLRMACFLDAQSRAPDPRLLLQAFRGAGKSTLAGLFAAWLLLRDPSTRILILAAEEGLATRMADAVRVVVERHILTAHLKPARAQPWASAKFTVARPPGLREPSVLARGLSANITGSRAEWVICDDVEVPSTCETPGARQTLRRRLTEIPFVLVPGGGQLYLGTPHTHETLYGDFLEGFARLDIPALDAAGRSAWPERFPPEVLERIRTQAGPAAFAAQMMLQPGALVSGRLDADLLRPYAGEPVFAQDYGGVVLDGREVTGVSAFWDPAYGGAGGDRSAVAVVFRDAQGDLLLHEVRYLSFLPQEKETDCRAMEQCHEVARLCARYRLPAITVETNGMGKLLPGYLRRSLMRHKVRTRVREAVSTRPKSVRILEAWDAPLAAGALWAHARRVLG
ncbi:MAG TPA: hypothetical protein DDX54_06750, partial [Rhodospirillaceae bacterium]|nr:hypothetical protein [Rhodospirillaceae bacterium]